MSLYGQTYNALKELYGEPTWRPHLPPVDELVNTILSQNTNDVNRDVAFEQMRTRFPTWELVRDAPLEALIEAIRPAGLAQQKAPRIQNALRELTKQRGEITLDFVAQMPLEEARVWLLALPGVGPKTAAIVLLFALGRPAFPVDTHVHRVTGRLGLIPPGMSADKAHQHLEQLAPPEHYYALHLNLIRHGREVCHARKPNCAACALRPFCTYFRNLETIE